MDETTNNSLVLMEEDSGIAGKLMSRTAMVCTMKPQDDAERAALFNAMNNPEKRLRECVNMTLMIKDVFCEEVEILDKKTGELKRCPRIVLIDENLIGYQCVSMGVFSALKKIIRLYGEPTWETPIPLEVKLIAKGERVITTLNIVAS